MSPLVLLHGFTGSPVSFRGVLARLPLEARVSAPSLPGHDDTPPPATLEDAFGVIDESVDALGEAATLVGYSLGGRLAMHYALAYPERVSRLVLLGARPGLTSPEERLKRLDTDRQWGVLLRAEGLEAFLSRWEAQDLLKPRTPIPDAVEESRAIRRRHSPVGLACAIEVFSVAALPDLWPRLPELEMPVTWAAGEHDSSYRALMQRAARSKGRYFEVPDAGHSVLVDNPGAIAELVDRER